MRPVRRTDAQHAFVTEEKGAACGKLDATFITDCDYDQAGAILRHIYPDVTTRKTQPSAALIVFSQAPFTQGLSAHGLADAGYAYVPPDCRDRAGCRVHVVFHGCKQAGEGFVRDSGYAEWADNNRLIVLFPQVKASSDGSNPLGCWDWWGYTGSDYLTRERAADRRRRADAPALGPAATAELKTAQPTRSGTLGRVAPLAAPSATTRERRHRRCMLGVVAGVAEPVGEEVQQRAHARQHVLGARIDRPQRRVGGDLEVAEHLHQLARALLAGHLELGGANEAEALDRGPAQQLAVVGPERAAHPHRGFCAGSGPEGPLPATRPAPGSRGARGLPARSGSPARAK